MERPQALPRSFFKHFCPLQTRWADNDQFGHINNAVYFTYFDLVVNVWMSETFDYHHLKADYRALVVETKANFFSECAYPEPLELGLSCTKITNSSITYAIGVFRKGEDLSAVTGQFIQVVVNTNTKRPISVPDEFRAALAKIASA